MPNQPQQTTRGGETHRSTGIYSDMRWHIFWPHVAKKFKNINSQKTQLILHVDQVGKNWNALKNSHVASLEIHSVCAIFFPKHRGGLTCHPAKPTGRVGCCTRTHPRPSMCSVFSYDMITTSHATESWLTPRFMRSSTSILLGASDWFEWDPTFQTISPLRAVLKVDEHSHYHIAKFSGGVCL